MRPSQRFAPGSQARLPIAGSAACAKAPSSASRPVTYAAVAWANVAGGIKCGARYLGNLDVTLEVDARTGPVKALIVGTHQRHQVARRVAALWAMRPTSVTLRPTTAESSRRPHRLVLCRKGGANAMLPGMIDTPIAVDGPGPGPTFFELAPDLVVRAGLFDGVHGDPARPRRLTARLSEREGALGIAEIEQRWGQVKARLGAWAYSARVVPLTSRDAPGSINRGLYAFVEGPLAAPDEDGRSLDGWLRVGVAEARVNPITRYVGGGIVRRGIWSHNDALGLAVAHAVLSNGMETSIEANYARSAGRRLLVQPTVQVIHNPGGSRRPTLALVIGARLIWRSDG